MLTADTLDLAGAQRALSDLTLGGMGPAQRNARNIVALPPRPRTVRDVTELMERLPAAELLPSARSLLATAALRGDVPGAATGNLHAIYAAMLACTRLLDDAAYPWDGMNDRAPDAPAGRAA